MRAAHAVRRPITARGSKTCLIGPPGCMGVKDSNLYRFPPPFKPLRDEVFDERTGFSPRRDRPVFLSNGCPTVSERCLRHSGGRISLICTFLRPESQLFDLVSWVLIVDERRSLEADWEVGGDGEMMVGARTSLDTSIWTRRWMEEKR